MSKYLSLNIVGQIIKRTHLKAVSIGRLDRIFAYQGLYYFLFHRCLLLASAGIIMY